MKEQDTNKFKDYCLDDYIKDVENEGLENTWDSICNYVIHNGENDKFLNINNFGEMYEIGLALKDKMLKKKSGQYYTPDDVAQLMGNWLLECNEENICDVACGTGKLIITYLNLIGEEKAKELINSGKIYLYDFDKTALMICKTSLIVKYSVKDEKVIHDYCCDFLDSEIKLPSNCRVISNPPYAKIEKMSENWNKTNVLSDTKEYYSVFMEKIFNEAKSAVVITPFSFINGNKFYSLRKHMSELGNGFVVSFDNVPGNIFCGRKHGIFNTNTSNSVRAAITVFHKDNNKKGYKISPLIRFKNEEREQLLKPELLYNLLPETLQIVNDSNKSFTKINKELQEVYEGWVDSSDENIGKLATKEETQFRIDMPNTCRYYTTASCKKLNRTGSNTLYFTNKEDYDIAYCVINSSFAYWWWRIYDGGITYPVGLLNSIPIPKKKLSNEDFEFFNKISHEMQSKESEYIVTKVNAGVAQENIKFPDEYRKKINQRLLKIIGIDTNENVFNVIHANKFFDEVC